MRLTIVLIDDDADEVDFMQEAIADTAPMAVCLPFNNPVKAVKWLLESRHTFSPSHIFIDHNMPEMTGLECVESIRRIREFDAAIIVAISTTMNEIDSRQFTALGANFAFKKPDNMCAYRELLRVVLSGSVSQVPKS